MATEQDQARSIAERVARRVAGSATRSTVRGDSPVPAPSGAPVRDELTAIRTGLHDLERKLESIESKIVDRSSSGSAEPMRARVIDFVSSGAPQATPRAVASPPPPPPKASVSFTPTTQSPWTRTFDHPVDHPSQERFGIDEATVAELVEFFENEKKCSVEPGGKPCDHCSMCNSRGF